MSKGSGNTKNTRKYVTSAGKQSLYDDGRKVAKALGAPKGFSFKSTLENTKDVTYKIGDNQFTVRCWKDGEGEHIAVGTKNDHMEVHKYKGLEGWRTSKNKYDMSYNKIDDVIKYFKLRIKNNLGVNL